MVLGRFGTPAYEDAIVVGWENVDSWGSILIKARSSWWADVGWRELWRGNWEVE